MNKEELIKVAEVYYDVKYAEYREQGHSRDMASMLACAFLEGFLENYTQRHLEKLSEEHRQGFLAMIDEVERALGLRG